MAWALWLAVPVVATVLAAVGTWVSARRAAAVRRPATAEAIRAHCAYLDALTVPARGTYRVAPPEGAGPGDSH
jgi:hypothetical protein